MQTKQNQPKHAVDTDAALNISTNGQFNAELLKTLKAVKQGDFSARLTVPSRGINGEIAATLNDTLNLNDNITQEFERLSRVVGREGKLSERAKQLGVLKGSWASKVGAINALIGDLVQPISAVEQVIGAVARGELSKKMPITIEGRSFKGSFANIANTVNIMVDQLNAFSSEVTRVAKEVGTDGKLGGQAKVKGVAGTWKDLTDNVNQMTNNLTGQVRNIAEVATAVANGDLSKKITVEVKGEILKLKNTINIMVDQLNGFSSEVTRVAREVGTEGKLGGQATVKGVGGTWKDLTDNVNSMANNLTTQVRNIAEVTTAVAKGDLSKKITVDVKGEVLQLKNTINVMVDQLGGFASEVTRVAKEVGTEGKLGGQAEVRGVAGTWKDLTDNVNSMAGNLTSQVRNIAEVTTAVAQGDLSKKITVTVRGEIQELKNTINTMVDQLKSFSSEVTRVAKEVGTEGKLGGQAEVRGVAGTWKDLTDNVNSMAGNLTSQVRNIAEVTTAVARGDLSKKITVDVKGEVLELKSTINVMVDQLGGFASEVTRVAREVGTEGKLGGQADVRGVAGTWKDLTENVNLMANNLTTQVRNIADVTTAVAKGDLSKKITVDVKGEVLQLKNTINVMVDQLGGFASEVTRVAREVGTEGKLGGQADVRGVAGTWKDLTENVNLMAGNLTDQVRNIAEVTTAVATGDLSRKITVEVKGEILKLKTTINTMVDQLNAFASEVTRVAREVGTEGKLGGQAQVKGVAGVWKDLTDNVNQMGVNLTDQVRGIAKVVTEVADGNLKSKLALQAKGEIATLADTINSMIDTLATFAEQVTNVAREVGVEGKLGGQAKVPGAVGIWRDLTDNVNQLAANLTTQVRAIAEVATAVTKGDLTRSITVEAKAEVEELKNNINEMIRNLRETTKVNTEQDWLKTNLTKFGRMLQGQRDINSVCEQILSELAPLVSAQHGVFYLHEQEGGQSLLKLRGTYAYKERKNLSTKFQLGEGLVGQCAQEKKRILLTHVPGDYIQIASGLGEATPMNIIVIPVLFEGTVKGVIELASFNRFSEAHQAFLDQLTESIGIVLNTIEATMRTEGLLEQSQKMGKTLQTQQEELQQTNEELEEKAKLLGEQKKEVETKNREVEQSRGALEEKALQLALTSKYKSEFLANMSHELRTPLNSLMILSKMLSENTEKNLTEKQSEQARAIHSSGSDLLNLINDILDLSKIEAGKMTLEIADLPFEEIQLTAERNFAHVAKSKNLAFQVERAKNLPVSIRTDSKRLEQIIKNMFSNAFKFTEKGSVSLRMEAVTSGWNMETVSLTRAETVIAFSVSDTGIGIAPEKQQIIFEAFQQADTGTARKYGGTGLGLSISRELTRLLGGEIRLLSQPGEGSTFTLYLPVRYEQLGAPQEMTTITKPHLTSRGKPLPASPLNKGEEHSPSLVKEGAGGSFGVGGVDELEPTVADDRMAVQPGEKSLLIIEDDLKFARILLDLAREKGFHGIVATRGADALALAERLTPSAITLDIHLPDMDGWVILDSLKHNEATRHIPVHIISVEEERERGLKLGALAYLSKPTTQEALNQALAKMTSYIERPTKSLLVIEDNETQRDSIVALIGNGDVETTAVGSGAAAIAALQSKSYDCVVLDLGLPDMSGFELIDKIKGELSMPDIPIIIYTGRELTKKEETRLRRVSEAIIIKDVKSPERLLDETSLFLHRVSSRLSESKRQMIHDLHQTDPELSGKKILIVDDDMRNIFALTTALERHQMAPLHAEGGQECLDLLQKTRGIDIILMDIMMPGMDGYEAIRRIREMERFRAIPIICLTAKAMKGDREKCIEAGASDYIPKPVDIDQLLSLLRVWLYK